MSGPLDGIRAVDLSQVIAGPYGTALLSYAGVDVIKVEAPGGESGRNLAGGFFGYNRGKRAICIDLQKPEGQAVFHRLARDWADVIVENFRPGVVERLNVDYKTIASLNPRIIYVSATAFGSSGPYSHRPGYDPLLQAMTGVERAQGGRHNPPVFLRIAITDLTTGLMHAAAIAMALYHRERTGRGQHVKASLMRSGIFINGDAFTRYPGRPARILPDAGQHGLGPLDRMYETKDGWIFILVEDDQGRWEKLCSVPGLGEALADGRFRTPADRAQHADDLAAVLEKAFRSDSAEAWLAKLEAAGVPAAPVIEGYGRQFFEDVQPIVNRYTVFGEHPERGHMEQSGNYIGYSLTPTSQEGRTAPLLGQHTDEIMAELGYSEAEVASLRAAGAIA
ncbi:MAG TPA: CoA transferase [Dehalococcoidia bacterium]|nr:CoA transferase [Dehalococcoidia bacterium]